jgi:hypothetical protein
MTLLGKFVQSEAIIDHQAPGKRPNRFVFG